MGQSTITIQGNHARQMLPAEIIGCRITVPACPPLSECELDVPFSYGHTRKENTQPGLQAALNEVFLFPFPPSPIASKIREQNTSPSSIPPYLSHQHITTSPLSYSTYLKTPSNPTETLYHTPPKVPIHANTASLDEYTIQSHPAHHPARRPLAEKQERGLQYLSEIIRPREKQPH